MSATATARRVRSAGRFAVRNGAPDGDGRNRRKRDGKGAPWRSGLPDRFTPAPISPRRLWRSRRTLCRTDNRRNRSPSRSAAGRFAIRNGAPDCDGCNRAGDLSGNHSPCRSRRTRCAVQSPPDRFGHNRRKRDGNRPPWRSDLPDRFAPVPICRRVPVPRAVRPVAFRQSAAPPSAMSRTGSDTVRRPDLAGQSAMSRTGKQAATVRHVAISPDGLPWQRCGRSRSAGRVRVRPDLAAPPVVFLCAACGDLPDGSRFGTVRRKTKTPRPNYGTRRNGSQGVRLISSRTSSRTSSPWRFSSRASPQPSPPWVSSPWVSSSCSGFPFRFPACTVPTRGRARR